MRMLHKGISNTRIDFLIVAHAIPDAGTKQSAAEGQDQNTPDHAEEAEIRPHAEHYAHKLSPPPPPPTQQHHQGDSLISVEINAWCSVCRESASKGFKGRGGGWIQVPDRDAD